MILFTARYENTTKFKLRGKLVDYGKTDDDSMISKSQGKLRRKVEGFTKS